MTPEIPGYRILRELGKGGMGMVYVAERESDEVELALKILPPHLITPVTARRFQREGRALQSIDHPNVVKVHDVGAREGNHYIAMEYVRGAPLSRELRTNPKGIPVDVVLRYATDVALALQAIHDRGITHRDLKPGNVMVTDQGRAKLLDFGLVQVDGLTMLTATGNIVGTPRYMSPEQCAGLPTDSRSDIYSLGVLLYEMLTGIPPFQSESVYDLLELQKTATPEIPSRFRKKIPQDLEQITLHCLAKDPSERPQRIREVLAVLAPECSAVPADGARPEGRVNGPGKEHRRGHRRPRVQRRTPVTTLIWGLVLISAGIAGLLFIPHPTAVALRAKVSQIISQVRIGDSSGSYPVQVTPESLAAAEAAYAAGRSHENSGRLQQAFDSYRQAHQSCRREARYLLALIGVAEPVGRRDDVETLVSEYLAQSNATDPGGILMHWLEGN